jgi:hypothetical protein
MGGLNANIILQAGQPAQTPVNSFGDMYAKAMQQKQQRTMQAAALQTQQMEMQQKQMELQQAQANHVQQQGVLQALQGSNGDVNAAIEILRKQGNPQYLALEKHKAETEKEVLENKQKADALAKSAAEQQAQKLGHIASLTAGIEDLPEALQGTAYMSRRQLAIQAGYATPDSLPAVWNEQTKQIVSGLRDNALSAKDQIDLKLKSQAQAQTAMNEDRNFGQTVKRDDQTAQNQLLTRLLQERGQNQTANYQQQEIGLRKQQLGLEGQRVGMEGQRLKQQAASDDPVSALSAGERNMVEQIIKGETKMPPAGARNSTAARIRAAAFQLDPNLNDERYTVNQSFKAGKDATDVGSITRILGHLDQYSKQSESLGNSAGLLFHLPNSAGIRQTSSAISEEFGKLVKGGALTQTEAAQREHDLLSPVKATRDGAINSLKDLMGSQFEAKFQKYKTATGQDLDPSKFFDKATQERLKKQNLVPGSSSGGPAGVPTVGGSFNGEKVLKVTRIK